MKLSRRALRNIRDGCAFRRVRIFGGFLARARRSIRCAYPFHISDNNYTVKFHARGKEEADHRSPRHGKYDAKCTSRFCHCREYEVALLPRENGASERDGRIDRRTMCRVVTGITFGARIYRRVASESRVWRERC